MLHCYNLKGSGIETVWESCLSVSPLGWNLPSPAGQWCPQHHLPLSSFHPSQISVALSPLGFFFSSSLISLHFSPSQTRFFIIFRPFCSSLAAAERRIHAIELFLLCLYKLHCLYVALYIYTWSHVSVLSVSLHKCVCWFHWQRFVNSWWNVSVVIGQICSYLVKSWSSFSCPILWISALQGPARTHHLSVLIYFLTFSVCLFPIVTRFFSLHCFFSFSFCFVPLSIVSNLFHHTNF